MRIRGGVVAACALAAVGCGEKSGGDDPTGAGSGDEAAAPEVAERTFELPLEHAGRNQTIRVTAPLPAWELETGLSKDQHQVYRGTNVVRVGGPWFAMSLQCHGSCQAGALRDNIGAYLQKESERFEHEAGEGGTVEVDTIGAPDQDRYGFAIRQLDADGAVTDVHVGVARFLPDGYDRFVWCSAMLPDEYAAQWQTLLDGCKEMQVEVVDPILTPEVLAAEAAVLEECPAASAVTIEPGESGSELDDAIPADAEVKDVYAYAPRPGNVQVVLASFPLASSSFGRKENQLTEGQVAVKLDLYAAEGKDIVSGDYGAATEPPRVDARIHVAGGRAFAVGTGEGQVTIVARTMDRICGTFDLKGRHHHLSGTFAAPLHWDAKRRPR